MVYIAAMNERAVLKKPFRWSGFTIVELLVVIAIVVLLASLLLPTLSRARFQARLVGCASNLRQIATACNTYASDADGFYPGYRTTPFPTQLRARSYEFASLTELAPYCGSSLDYKKNALFRCPEGYLTFKRLSGASATAFYSLYNNIQCGLYNGTYKWASMTTMPRDLSDLLSRPGDTQRLGTFGGAWGPSGLYYKILASDICISGGGNLATSHWWGGRVTLGGGGAVNWKGTESTATANYVFTDGSVRSQQINPVGAEAYMVAAINSAVDWDSYWFPRAWGSTAP